LFTPLFSLFCQRLPQRCFSTVSSSMT
jgi:hypothetical protein